MRLRTFLLALLTLLALTSSAMATEKLLWQIGKPDNDYSEFAIARNWNAYPGTFKPNVSFTVGKDDPATSWPFIHPGPSDAWAKSRAHTYTVHFQLADQPTGAFTLLIDFVSVHGGDPPTYVVAVNGVDAPLQLPAGPGDEVLADPTKGKEYVLRVALPASAFKQGGNQITMSIARGSWAIYDAVSLSNDPEASLPPATVDHLSLNPTILLVQREGKLENVVELTAQFSRSGSRGEAIVTVGGITRKLSLESNLIGSVTAELTVPEVTKPTEATASITLGDHTTTASCTVKPQRHWLLYVQPSAHVDIGYTDLQERVAQRHNENMSVALDLCARYPEFKWNTEAAWVEDNYLTMVPSAKKADFIKMARDGRVGCQAMYGNMLTGICSHESLIRCLYYAHSTAKQYGIPFDNAMTSDVPTQVWTFPTVLAGSGIRYLSIGVNRTRGDPFDRVFGKSPFYWQGPDGSRVLTWMQDGYGTTAGLMRGGSDAARLQVRNFLGRYDRDDYPFDAVLGFGGFSDNQPVDPAVFQAVHDWNARYTYPRIIPCRGTEFFQHIEKSFASSIPTISGDGGVYWEDGAGSSANETSMCRRAKETLVAAEKLHSLTSTLTGSAYPTASFDNAWKNAILYDEHTWGAAGSIGDPRGAQTVGQWERKSHFAREAQRISDELLQQGLKELAAKVACDEPSVLVFNPLSWPMSGPVRFTKQLAPVDLWVENVPPLGYKSFPLSASKTQTQQPIASATRFRNRYYTLDVDPATGEITSLFDTWLNRDLADHKAPYCINQYVYVKGKGKDAQVVSGDQGPATITSERLPYGTRITIRKSAYNAPEIKSEIILYDKVKRIDFVNTLNKTETFDKEAGYFAFPFALEKPSFRVELPDGVMEPGRNTLPGGCMEWYCMQDTVCVIGTGCAITWTAVDSPLVTLGDINHDSFKSPIPINNAHLFAYILNNYWFTNYKAGQGGEMTFRFSLTSSAIHNPAAASRFGQSVRNPLLATLRGKNTGELPTTASLLSIAPSNVVIQTVKEAESGKGIIIRLREVSGAKTLATLTLPAGRFTRAATCSLVEDTQRNLNIQHDKVNISIPANGLATVVVSK